MMFSNLLAGLNSVQSFLTQIESGPPLGHRQFAYVPATPRSSMTLLDGHKHQRLCDARRTGYPSQRYRGTR